MSEDSQKSEALLRAVQNGDESATRKLFDLHRDRLRQMITLRLDPQMAARVDPSDVVQETFLAALDRLPDYARRRPVPFFAWLRQLAYDRLIDQYRFHIEAQKRWEALQSAQKQVETLYARWEELEKKAK